MLQQNVVGQRWSPVPVPRAVRVDPRQLASARAPELPLPETRLASRSSSLDPESDDEFAEEQEEKFREKFFRALDLYLEVLAGVVILLNVGFMAYQTDHPDQDHTLVNGLFLGFFIAELALRLGIAGCIPFFCTQDPFWNNFDFLIVVLATVDWVIDRFVSEQNATLKRLTILRVLRTLRIARIFRLARIPAFRRLGLYMRGLVDALKIVMWVAVLFIMIILVYAITCTTLIGQQSHRWKHEEDEDGVLLRDKVEMYFGTVWKSSTTLFQFVTLDDWSNITRLVWDKMGAGYAVFFITFVVIASIVVLALLTGVVTDHLLEVHRQEELEDEKAMQEKLANTMKAFYKLFQLLDKDSNGSIDINEFRLLLKLFQKDGETVEQWEAELGLMDVLDKNPEISDVLADVGHKFEGLDPEDLFNSIDVNHTGSISWDEFKTSMLELNEGVSLKQIFKLQVTMQKLASEQTTLFQGTKQAETPYMSHKVEDQIEEVQHSVHELDSLMKSFEMSLQDLMQVMRDEAEEG